jgi:hypothetical protein
MISFIIPARYESKWVRDILYGRRAQDSRKPTKVV